MTSKKVNSEIEYIANTLLCLSEQMALQPPKNRDNRLITLLHDLGERLNQIPSH